MDLDLTDAVEAAARVWVKQLNAYVPPTAGHVTMRWENMSPYAQHKVREDLFPVIVAAVKSLYPQLVQHQFTEDVNDASMCTCGLPALGHP